MSEEILQILADALKIKRFMRKIIEGRLENARLFPSVGRPSGKVYNTNVMKTHLSRAVLLLPLVFLSSCAAPKSVQISDYIDTDVAFKENFRLLQLTDIHWSVNTDPIKQGAYLSKVVEITNPDFIMNDVFEFAAFFGDERRVGGDTGDDPISGDIPDVGDVGSINKEFHSFSSPQVLDGLNVLPFLKPFEKSFVRPKSISS